MDLLGVTGRSGLVIGVIGAVDRDGPPIGDPGLHQMSSELDVDECSSADEDELTGSAGGPRLKGDPPVDDVEDRPGVSPMLDEVGEDEPDE